MQPIVLATLADFQRHRYTVSFHCWRCQRWADPDISTLIGRLGPDYEVTALRCRCTTCGEPGAAQVQPPMREGWPVRSFEVDGRESAS